MTSEQPNTGEPIRLLGIIIPSDWDLDGKATAYTLSTFDEKEYRLRHEDNREPDIEHFAGEKVIIKGILQQDRGYPLLYVETIAPF